MIGAQDVSTGAVGPATAMQFSQCTSVHAFASVPDGPPELGSLCLFAKSNVGAAEHSGSEYISAATLQVLL